MEISPEMQEAIRILREDGRIAEYRKMTESHKELVERLDHLENKGAERDAAWEAKFGEKKAAGPEGQPAVVADVEVDDTKVTPPPVKAPEPAKEKTGRKRWYESEVYGE